MELLILCELVIESADTDVAGQIQQLQNLMSKNVDAILVNPGDVSGLNATLEEAVNKGIIVISVDQEIGAKGVYNVGIDQKEWAMTSAKWLAEKLGGTGNIVEIEGFPGHPANVARIREAEAALSAAGRYYIPQDRIAGVAEGIRDGDIIAATSTVEGLDVAHTGLALWVDGTLRLMHAPLVGDSVQISEIALAERIQGISGQDGIMVARPLER